MTWKCLSLHINSDVKLSMGQKFQIQDLLNKEYPKGQIKKFILFFLIYLDKIMSKNPINENKLKLKIVPSHKRVKI